MHITFMMRFILFILLLPDEGLDVDLRFIGGGVPFFVSLSFHTRFLSPLFSPRSGHLYPAKGFEGAMLAADRKRIFIARPRCNADRCNS